MEKVRLGDICVKQSSKLAQKDLENMDGSYPIFGASGLIKKINTYDQKAEYVAVVKDGAGVGRTMLLPAYSSVIGTLQYLIPNDNFNAKYLYYAVKSRHLEKYYTGSAIPHIYFKDYKSEPIILFDRIAQKKIVLVLERVEKIIEKQKQQLEMLDTLIKARFVEMFGDPMNNPCGYEHIKLSDIATYFNGLTYKPENVTEDGTIVLRSSNIQNGQLDFLDTVRVNCAIKERIMVQENDILMCSRNGSAKLVGKVALVKDIQEPMSFGAFMMIIRSQYFGYLMTYFQMDAFRQQIKTSATTTINQITGRMLDNITIPLPPITMVEQYTAFIEQVDKSKSAIQKSLEKTQTLFDSLMQEYFG